MRNVTKRAAIITAVPVILVLSACGGDEPDLTGGDAEASPEAVEPPESETTQPESTTEKSPDSVGTEASAAAEQFEMPDLVGMTLQTAQDTLQSLGSYLMDQEDATDLDRMQLVDSNWQVCTQDPAAGSSTVTSEIITLSTVKLDETCP